MSNEGLFDRLSTSRSCPPSPSTALLDAAGKPGNESVLLLVDGHNLAYRAYHAIAPMSAPDGQPTQALFGFIRTLALLRNTLKATHIGVAFDGGIPPERLALHREYKAQRPPMPDALRSQFPLIERYLDYAGLRWVRVEQAEADDLLATLARGAEKDATRVYLASTDRDLMQQVGPTTWLVEPSRRATITDAKAVENKTGVTPTRIPEWRALVGDSSDNIPGVPGVGPKTAARLLRSFETLDALWAGLPSVEPVRLRQALSDYRARVERNLALIRLDDHAPCPLSWRDCVPGPGNPRELTALFRQVGFQRLLREQEEPRLLL